MTAALNTRGYLLRRFGRGRRGRSPTTLPQMGRRHLPTLCRELGWTKGAEIGVWKGAYSAQFCQVNPRMHMLCVDPWISYPAWLDTKNSMPPVEAAAFMAAAYQTALQTLSPLNCQIIRKFSEDAAKDVSDGSLDFVFIDGNHTFDAVTTDLLAWAPKVRAGGILAGHDYRRFSNKPTIHVIEAVTAYVRERQIAPWYVTGADRTPSFFWIVE